MHFFKLSPQGQKAYLKGPTLYNHVGSVQQRWDLGPGESVACWVAVDYSKAYGSVTHPMLRALFRYICIPAAWVHVVCQILCGLVLFLVGGGVQFGRKSYAPRLGFVRATHDELCAHATLSRPAYLALAASGVPLLWNPTCGPGEYFPAFAIPREPSGTGAPTVLNPYAHTPTLPTQHKPLS